MDPKAVIQRILDAMNEQDWEETEEALSDLFTWLKGGGFVPEVSDDVWIAYHNGKTSGRCYSILPQYTEGTRSGTRFTEYRFNRNTGQFDLPVFDKVG